MAWTLKKNEHVRVDVIYQKLSHRTQKLIDNIGHIFFLLPLCWILFQHGWTNAEISMSYPSQRAMDHYSMLWLGHEHSLYPILSSLEHFLRTWILIGEGSSMAGGLEARWIPKAFIPLGALLLALQGISLIIDNILPMEQADETKALTPRQPQEDL
jgi:TRAP-type mannitol/chloroaromatic compound transport system permease small subunit